MSRKRVGAGLLFGALVALVWFSARLAAIRVYQVDECQNLYMARVLATGRAAEFFTNASLFLMGPLSWISRSASESESVFGAGRLLFLGVFWLNLFLLAAIAGERLRSTRGLVALVAAATLAPLWDYGFEIRHDNVILLGILLIWWAVRTRPMGVRSYILAGAVALAMLFIAVKSVVYALPISLAILVFPPPAHENSRWRLGLAWLGGALLATVLIRLGYGRGGGWATYLSVFHVVAKFSAGAAGHDGSGSGTFGPGRALARLVSETPLLVAFGMAAVVAFLMDWRQRGKAVLCWDGMLPELLLVAGAIGALMVNPTPFLYNLVNVVPFLFLLSFKYCSALWREFEENAALKPALAMVLVFAYLLPFCQITSRHWDWLNYRQQTLMRLAEDLTEPRDPVYDGVGMVLTRPSVGYQWYLHSLNIKSFRERDGARLPEMLTLRPAAIFIPSYRTDWLPKSDHTFITNRYVPLADDFWVLGKVLPAGGGTFEIFHPGRYRISSLRSSDLAGTSAGGWEAYFTPEDKDQLTGTLDGRPLGEHPVELCIGLHHIETTPDCQPAVVWVGPRRDRPHRLPPGDHDMLFVNGY